MNNNDIALLKKIIEGFDNYLSQERELSATIDSINGWLADLQYLDKFKNSTLIIFISLLLDELKIKPEKEVRETLRLIKDALKKALPDRGQELKLISEQSFFNDEIIIAPVENGAIAPLPTNWDIVHEAVKIKNRGTICISIKKIDPMVKSTTINLVNHHPKNTKQLFNHTVDLPNKKIFIGDSSGKGIILNSAGLTSQPSFYYQTSNGVLDLFIDSNDINP